jgi:hypothetical protein
LALRSQLESSVILSEVEWPLGAIAAAVILWTCRSHLSRVRLKQSYNPDQVEVPAAMLGRVLRLAAVAAPPWLLLGMQQPVAKVDFAADVAPMLKAKCASCHGRDVQSGGLRLDTIGGIKKGGVTGPLFTAGKGKDSLLIQRILGHGGKPRMPMGFAPLSDQVTAKITAWIDQGANFAAKGGKHWAYMPPKRPALPPVRAKSWVRNPIDAFVLARLEKEGLVPSAQASKETLARRAALDLTGLPPTVSELQAFLNDRRLDAYERYVDRLLASPHYGERMARIWLDLARYADTNGYEKDLPRQMSAWRDWVIKAFNKNMPFDQFTIEQLAGDLLPNPTRDQLIATGFHRNSMLNDEGGVDIEEFRVVAVIDRVDTTATTWLGTTMACAQCHDHKYDPISQKDYYRFFAFFNQTEDNGRDAQPIVRLTNAEQQKVLDRLSGDIKLWQRELEQIAIPGAMKRMGDWERKQATAWKTPLPAATAKSATVTVLPDRSVLASGPDPELETYTITLPLEGGARYSGLRLEVIPDPSLPQGSSGRNPNGSFVLGGISAAFKRANAGDERIEFSTAVADFTQQGHDPASLIGSGTGPGWAVAGFQPEHRVTHTLVAEFKHPLFAQPGDILTLTLTHNPRFLHHNLGRFRISLTEHPWLPKETPPSAAIRSILAKDKRSETEAKQLQEFYLSADLYLRELRSKLATLNRQKSELENKAPYVMVLKDLAKPRPDRILKRGDFRTPGDSVSAGVPEFLGGASTPANRLGLAKWLVSPSNPLTARVQVNRLWEQCFGRGLVATMEDFGTQGERPSHPELLDWLATELIARKWDVKAMLRLIVTSATYRQSARSSAALVKRDPYNVLLARGPRFRMEAESVRDIALRASGRLIPIIGGRSVMPPQPGGIWENSFTFYDTKDRWVDAEGPNRYRRGLYTYWRRTAPYPMSMTFDLKSRDMCAPHRSRTNTPLQALNTLNDPVFIECAGALGQKMAGFGSDSKGIEYGYLASVSRRPSAKEVATLQRLLAAARVKYRRDAGSAEALLKTARVNAKSGTAAEVAAWIVVANALLNLDETITKG